MKPFDAIMRIEMFITFMVAANKTNEQIPLIQALKMAVNALSKNVATKPIIKSSRFYDHKIGKCACGRSIRQNMQYCPRCGQKINWEGESE